MQTRNPVGWFEIYVADMAHAKAFYQAVFGQPLTQLANDIDKDMWAFAGQPNAGGAAGALVKSSDMQPGACGTLVYFSCADVAVEASKAAQAGGKVCQPKMSIGEYGFIAIVQDTEGNTIGLHSLA